MVTHNNPYSKGGLGELTLYGHSHMCNSYLVNLPKSINPPIKTPYNLKLNFVGWSSLITLPLEYLCFNKKSTKSRKRGDSLIN